MRRPERLVPLLAILVAFTAFGWAIRYAIQGQRAYNKRIDQQHQLVQGMCDLSRGESSGRSEELCGIAQDATNTVYHCNQLAQYCWVADK